MNPRFFIFLALISVFLPRIAFSDSWSGSHEQLKSLDSFSSLFEDADFVAIIRFVPGAGRYFSVDKILFPLDFTNDDMERIFFRYQDVSMGFYTSEVIRTENTEGTIVSPVIYEDIPYLAFLRISENVELKEGVEQPIFNKDEEKYDLLDSGRYNVFSFVQARHGVTPLIDMEDALDYEGVEKKFARGWHNYFKKASPSTPNEINQRMVLDIMVNDYGTTDGTVILDAITGIRKIFEEEDASSRAALLLKDDYLENPAFIRMSRDLIKAVDFQSFENLRGSKKND